MPRAHEKYLYEKNTITFPQTTEGRTHVLKNFALRKHCLDLKTERFEYDREFKSLEISPSICT